MIRFVKRQMVAGLRLFRVYHFSIEPEFEFFTLPSSPFTLQQVPQIDRFFDEFQGILPKEGPSFHFKPVTYTVPGIPRNSHQARTVKSGPGKSFRQGPVTGDCP
jgi:hypothetical protein